MGSEEYVNQFVSDEVDQCIAKLESLTTIASSQPQAAYACLIHGLSSKWLYLARTTPHIQHHLERVILTSLIPTLTGQPPPNKTYRNIFALPVRHGGLGIHNPSVQAPLEFAASIEICSPIVEQIMAGNSEYTYKCESSQMLKKSEIKSERVNREKERLQHLQAAVSPEDRKVLELAGENEVSSWHTAFPIALFGFVLHKRAFTDALALRYGWQPNNLPTHCACVVVPISLSLPVLPEGGISIYSTQRNSRFNSLFID